MSPLHSPSATPTAPDRNAKLNELDPRFRNLGLELRNGLALFQPTSASRTAGRQRYFHDFIDLIGEGPTIAAPILLSCFASGFLRMTFGFLPREGGRLSLRGSKSLFQQPPQTFVFFLQYFNFFLEPRELFCGMLFCHTDKITTSRMQTTTFLRKSV